MQEAILHFFQSVATPFLDKFFTYITMLGEQYFIIIIVAWIFWNYSKKDGIIMMIIFLISTMLNLLLKDVFQTRRPFQKLDNFNGKRVETAIGFSFPSGHTQGATTLFMNLALIFKKVKYLILAIFLSILVAISRVYLGVHWPIDVLGGLVGAIVVVLVFYPYLSRIDDNPKMFFKVLFFILAVFYFILIILICLNQFALSNPLDLKNYIIVNGILSGCILGYYFEEKRMPFANSGKVWKKILRYIFGMAISILILVGLKNILPENFLSSWFRYFLVGAWITGLFPMIGLKLKLFEKEISKA